MKVLIIALGLLLSACAPTTPPHRPGYGYGYPGGTGYTQQPLSQINQQLWQLQQLQRNLRALRRY